MNIALIPTPELRCETGSTLHAVQLALGLARAGHEVHVFALNHPASVESGLHFHDLPLPLVHPVLIDRAITDEQIGAMVSLIVAAVARENNKARFDVVHAHYATMTGYCGSIVQDLFGIPLVISCFGRDLTIGAPNDPRYERMVEACLERTRIVIASDDSVAELLDSRYKINKSRLRVIPMGIDSNFSILSGADKPTDSVVEFINISSCFSPEKGLDTLLRATAILHQKGIYFTLSVIGEDDLPNQDHAVQLRNLHRALALDEHVMFFGRIPHRDIPHYLSAADVLVDPRVTGNFSSATLEALFAGRPVIASDVASNRLIIKDGDNGLLFPAGDAEALATRMADLAVDDNLRKVVGLGAVRWRERFGAPYSERSVCDHTLAAYEDACRDDSVY